MPQIIQISFGKVAWHKFCFLIFQQFNQKRKNGEYHCMNNGRILSFTAKHLGFIAVLFACFFVQNVIEVKAQEKRVVQAVYIIPKGQTAKPNANKVIIKILHILQRHYYEQLGTTFKLKEKSLVTTIYSDQSADSYSDPKVELLTGWNNGVEIIKTKLKTDFLDNENNILVIIEGTTGFARGGNGLARMTGDFWNPAYRIFNDNPAELSKNLFAWSHELGHAFGLDHTSDTATCFAKNYNKTLNYKHLSLIMQWSKDLEDLDKYPLLQEEKEMLLNEKSYPLCLTNRGDRPHASNYLKYSPKLNLNGNWVGYYADGSKSEYIWRISQTGNSLSMTDVGTNSKSSSNGLIEGNRVIATNFNNSGRLHISGSKIIWSDKIVWVKDYSQYYFYDSGYFLNKGNRSWVEKNIGEKKVYYFLEVKEKEDNDFIYLLDKSRKPGVWVALPKAGKGNQIFSGWEGGKWEKLFVVK